MTVKYPIAMIPYANMAPFQEMGPPTDCTFVDYLPKESIQALKEKKVWAAAVPVGGLAALGGQVHYLGRFGIAVKARVMSVLLFSDRPFEQLYRPLTIGLTDESASSVRLLYLLMGYQYGFNAVPYLALKNQKTNGYLVIGDRALRWARLFTQTGESHGFNYVTDLAEQWYDRFKLPFVFARWVIHREAPDFVRQIMQNWLDLFSRHEDELIQKAAPKVARQLDLPLAYTQAYLSVIRRCLTEDDEAGQKRFQQELKPHGDGMLFQTVPTSDS